MVFKKLLLVDVLHLNPQHEHFLHYFVFCFSYAQLVSLFEDIFIREEYYFVSSTQSPSIIDAGSHLGMSVLYFKYIYPKSKITAFEPDPDTFKLLLKNSETNHLKHVLFVNKAIAGRVGKKDFYYDERLPGSTIMSLLKHRYHTAKKQVLVTELSLYIKENKDLVKLDVEGMEQQVIDDLVRTNKVKNVQQFIIEYHHHIPETKDALSKLLVQLEKSSFSYQLTTLYKGPVIRKEYQDILVYATRQE